MRCCKQEILSLTNNVQILEKIDVWGYISYKVFNSATGKVYKVNEDQLTLIGETGKYNEDYLRYVILLSKIKSALQADRPSCCIQLMYTLRP